MCCLREDNGAKDFDRGDFWTVRLSSVPTHQRGIFDMPSPYHEEVTKLIPSPEDPSDRSHIDLELF